MSLTFKRAEAIIRNGDGARVVNTGDTNPHHNGYASLVFVSGRGNATVRIDGVGVVATHIDRLTEPVLETGAFRQDGAWTD